MSIHIAKGAIIAVVRRFDHEGLRQVQNSTISFTWGCRPSAHAHEELKALLNMEYGILNIRTMQAQQSM